MFKKGIATLVLAGAVFPALADDALVLPEGVMRTRIIPALSSFDERFDKDGERQDTNVGKVSLTTLSLALEYGVTDWLTAGLQWAPGVVVASDVENSENITLNGVNDLFAGAKLQLLGKTGLSANDNIRFAVTPGIKIPLSSYDADKELNNAFSGDEFSLSRTDRGAVGLGARLALDYQLTPNFYVNLYNQSILFLETNQDYEIDLQNGVALSDVDVKYAPELIFEGEPYYSLSAGKGIELGFGLPLTYTTVGDTEINGQSLDDAFTSLEFGPYASVFFTNWVLPMEFELGYSTTLAGENTPAVNTVSLQVKNFVKF